jgi:hypothetical protein
MARERWSRGKRKRERERGRGVRRKGRKRKGGMQEKECVKRRTERGVQER